jgi:hypothetical protein
MTAEVPLQANFLTGEFVDKRTRQQKQHDKERERPTQIEMFSQREIAQFGVRANPQLPLSEHTKLALIAYDPRTPEEIEQDRMREAQALTIPLFGEPASEQSSAILKPTIPPGADDIFSPPAYPLITDAVNTRNDEDVEKYAPAAPSPKLSKIAVYMELVNIAAERAATLYASSGVAIAQAITIAVIRSEAKYSGLTDVEIQMAIQIGEHSGRTVNSVVHEPKLSPVTPSLRLPQSGLIWMQRRTNERPEMSRL